ncbi:collagen alpha-1(I) chain-like [Onychostruthus taczanowskii]|uniref:collagen alpha-1(I) chain-like n=1 Tax=Onychostruthus taczanowskii TaxID=356909 RepID=UPI001B80892A|nr:collagen alpha-1(I) chain-like [Onychostruthus taczanowskii]XP_041279657.1 collagen alpha-1(I) chain-like [Onychostruthus taczanowskii]
MCWPAAGRDPGPGVLGRRGLPSASTRGRSSWGHHHPPSPPPRAPSHEGKAVRRASPGQEGRGGLRGMTRDNPGLSPASPAPLDPGGGDTAGTLRGSSPPLPASRRGAGVRCCILCDSLCDRRGCAAYIIPAGRTRTPHYIRDRAPAGPRGSPAGGRGDGGREKGRDPAAAPAEPLVNPLPVAFTRHGTFPERANVPPTSGNSHRGAARTRTPAHAPRRGAGCPRTHSHFPLSGTLAGTRWQPGHIPSLRYLQRPALRRAGWPRAPPLPWCPPIRSRGAGGRDECPVGSAPPAGASTRR